MKGIKNMKCLNETQLPNRALPVANNSVSLNNQVINYTPDLEFFLHSPIEKLEIESALKRKLILLRNTIYEVLSDYSEKDLRDIRGFGEKKIKDFKILLNENSSLHFFKQ